MANGNTATTLETLETHTNTIQHQHNAHPTPSTSSGAVDFVAAATFAGPRAGYVFTRGVQGVGYYRDRGLVQQQVGSAGSNANSVKQQHKGAGGAQATQGNGAAAGVIKNTKNDKKRKHTNDDDDEEDEGESSMDEEEEDGGIGVPSTIVSKRQRALIQQAFAGDDVAADFAEEKVCVWGGGGVYVTGIGCDRVLDVMCSCYTSTYLSRISHLHMTPMPFPPLYTWLPCPPPPHTQAAEVDAEHPMPETPGLLPGWGAWASQRTKTPQWVVDAQDKATEYGGESDVCTLSDVYIVGDDGRNVYSEVQCICVFLSNV